MKGFVLFFAALFSFTTFASTNHYHINAKIFIDGKLVASPHIVTLENEEAEINQVSENPHKEMKMRVIASDTGNEQVKDDILMKFHVQYLSDTRIVESNPQVLAKAGSEATIRIGDRQGDRDIQMKVVVSRE